MERPLPRSTILGRFHRKSKAAGSIALRLLLFFVLFVGPCAPASADAVDDYVKRHLRTDHIPGLSLVVLQNGRIVKSGGYGFSNVETGTKATVTTVYPIASVTKQFVAAGILLLQQDGNLSLDDKAARYLSGLPQSWSRITIRQLLNHTSGLPDIWNDLHADMRVPTTPEKIIQTVAAVPPLFAPGEKWEYSNTDYIVLASIITKISGEPFDSFLKRRIFDHLGMTRTRLFDPEAIVPERAGLYRREGGRLLNSAYVEPSVVRGGDGGLVSTAADLAKWDASLNGNDLLTEASRAQMWEKARLKDGTFVPYGLGWEIRQNSGHAWILHSGSRPGAEAIVSRFPDDGLAVILLTNLDHANALGMARGIAGLYQPALALPVYKPIRDDEPEMTSLATGLLSNGARPAPDESIFTPRMVALLKPDWDAFRSELGRLGRLKAISLVERRTDEKGGRTMYRYRALCEESIVLLLIAVRDGKIDDIGLQRE
jgi:CubicO group peptidase (beta-lactamase class C family)